MAIDPSPDELKDLKTNKKSLIFQRTLFKKIIRTTWK